MATLKGIAWNHTRGYVPMVATSQAFTERHEDVDFLWDRRSLWAFGEGSLADLAEQYDLIVLDHPWVPHGADQRLLVPLNEDLPAEWIAAQAADSAGPSHASYLYRGQQWAAAIDAACEVAAFRPDLMEERGWPLPKTYEEVLDLAGTTGAVLAPFNNIDALSHFFTLCANQGEPPIQIGGDQVVSREMGKQVLEQLRRLLKAVGTQCLDLNPIAVLNRMARGAQYVYCPYTFGYSNYSREGYQTSQLAFDNLPGVAGCGSRGAVLGGAGLAVSARSQHRTQALQYLQWVASAQCQRTLYVSSGGQPGSRSAWEDPLANALTGQFFASTVDTLRQAFVRPIHTNLPPFQTEAGGLLREYLLGAASKVDTLTALDLAWRRLRANPRQPPDLLP